MNDFLKQLASQRRKLLEALEDNRGDIDLDIFEDFYPDQAHFVFELLQNAEDAGATEAIFTLTEDGCKFEHDGTRAFTEADVRAITGIYSSTKKGAPDQIGRFGVGFKSVFGYTLTPTVQSGEFAFRIVRLVLPVPVEQDPRLGNVTRFKLPFGNHPRKTPEQAFREVRDVLAGLSETTLLFLSSLKSVRWQIAETTCGAVVRIQHPEEPKSERRSGGKHIEVRKQTDGVTVASSHFLRYDQPVESLENRWIAVAFELALLPDVKAFEPTRPLNEQMKIVPALQGHAPGGQVAIFFPAEKERSGLCFHVHAPFVPELSRASVKDTDANKPLFRQLAGLAASVLHDIRAQGLLTGDFLAVLPNVLDQSLQSPYQCIRSAIVEEMRSQPLTPTHAGGHAPAKDLLQAKATLKELLSEQDLGFLVAHDGQPLRWAIGAPKSSREDRFLVAFGIREWGTEKFVDVLVERASEAERFLPSPPRFVSEPDADFMRWLSEKPSAWHQDLYALLFSDYLESAGWQRGQLAEKLKPLRIVRLSNGNYSVGPKCFFRTDEAQHDDFRPRVDADVYTSGKSRTQQENARRLLVEMGVREVGEVENVESILEICYKSDDWLLLSRMDDGLGWHQETTRLFIGFVESHPDKASLFASYYIFRGEGGTHRTPSQVFLDAPFLETGLRAYYDGLGDRARRRALAADYLESGVPKERLVAFAKAVGVQTALEVTPAHCQLNPQWDMLGSGQVRKTSNNSFKRINSDYDVRELGKLAALRSEAASRLIWSTMINVVQPEHLIAIYKHNNQSPVQRGDSQLVHRLVAASWVPQLDGRFVRPADAIREQLPAGFPFDPGWPWIQAIGFGSNAPRESEEQRRKRAIAEELGFADDASLELGKWFAALPAEARDQIRADWNRQEATELPDRQSPNPERRASGVKAEAADATERLTEKRPRNVPIDLEKVKQDAAQYLRQQYTTDGGMICQACKRLLPFKLDDDTDYFEKVEFLRDLERRHHRNYLALCPNHAAMFQYANGSRDCLVDLFAEMTGNELPIKLAQKDVTVYFTMVHRDDLKAVIRAERKQSRSDGDTT